MSALSDFERLVGRKDKCSPEVYYAWLRARAELVGELTEIADADYRGNRSPESLHARRVLESWSKA